MENKNIELKVKNCVEVLDRELLIGSDSSMKKSFTFNVFKGEYRVWHNGECIDAGQAVEELLEVYNSIN